MLPRVAARSVHGLAAGCVGLVALEMVSYVDQYLRARPPSESPARLGEAVGDELGLDLGTGQRRANRAGAVGPLAGYWDGLLLGVAWSMLAPRDANALTGTGLLTAGAMVGSNGPLVAFGITDPRRWSREDWLSDLLPHLAYGIATTTTIAALRASQPR